MKRRLLFVDDDRRFCDLARPLLEPDFTLEIVHSVRAAVRSTFAAEVAVVDLGLPDGDGIDVIAALATRQALSILVLSSSDDAQTILAALRAGARGYLLKDDIARLRRAVDEVQAGESPMSATVARLVLLELRAQPPASAQLTLTPRELEVVDQLRGGLTYGEVAHALDVSTNTVRTHIRSVYDKLQVSSKTEAVLEAMRRGWLR